MPTHKPEVEIGSDEVSAESRGKTKKFIASGVSSGLAALAGVASMFLFWRLNSIPYPFEDAAMLFRYAEVLANGGGLAWNPGDDPALSDGATDLGFVLSLVPLMGLGFKSATAAMLLNLIGVFLVGASIGVLVRLLGTVPHWVALITAYGVSLSVASPVAGGFSSAIFGAILTVGFVLVFVEVGSAQSRRRPLVSGYAIGLWLGLAGWWRPEGFALGILVAAAGYFAKCSWNAGYVKVSGRQLLSFLGGVAAAAAAWVCFRMIYFGQLIPTAGVNKIAVSNQRDWLEPLAYYGSVLAWLWVALLLVAALRVRIDVVWKPAFFLVVVCVFWSLFSLTWNWWGRVFWPITPVLALFVVTHIATTGLPVSRAHGYRNWIPVPIAVAGAALFLFWITPEWNGRYFQPPWHTLMFSIFKPLDSSNFRVATTEAGLIPLALDEGQSLDTYVHNTRKIALEGEIGLQTSLEDFRPNILVVHGPPPVGFVDDSATCPYEGELWSFQQRVLYDYAEQNSFDLVRSDVRGPCDTWNVFANSEISEDSRVKIASPGNPW